MMKMNKRICKRLFLVGLALGLVLAGCGDSGEPKSTETAITELTLTIEGVAKTITFGKDGAASFELPVDASIPSTATVKSVTLSAGASGLVKDQKLTLTEGSVTVTITAEDGTTKKEYIVTVTIAKRNLNTATFSYATVETNEGVANDAGVEPAWTPPTGAPTPDQITYSIAGTTATANGNTGGTPAVDIDTATGKITITADAVEANSGDYTVEATANQNSSYLNGSKQTTTATVKVIVYNVGDDGPAGGKVFYDEGDYTKGWRYLEAAPSDQGDFAWGGDGDINGGTQDGIGSGKDNTDAIVATLQDNKNKAYAAKICNELVEGGFTDWFLPSKDELNKLYEQKDTLYEQKDTVGVFSYDYYWSSSAYASDSAWVQHFGQGNQNVDTRNLDNRVRAVRAF